MIVWGLITHHALCYDVTSPYSSRALCCAWCHLITLYFILSTSVELVQNYSSGLRGRMK